MSFPKSIWKNFLSLWKESRESQTRSKKIRHAILAATLILTVSAKLVIPELLIAKENNEARRLLNSLGDYDCDVTLMWGGKTTTAKATVLKSRAASELTTSSGIRLWTDNGDVFVDTRALFGEFGPRLFGTMDGKSYYYELHDSIKLPPVTKFPGLAEQISDTQNLKKIQELTESEFRGKTTYKNHIVLHEFSYEETLNLANMLQKLLSDNPPEDLVKNTLLDYAERAGAYAGDVLKAVIELPTAGSGLAGIVRESMDTIRAHNAHLTYTSGTRDGVVAYEAHLLDGEKIIASLSIEIHKTIYTDLTMPEQYSDFSEQITALEGFLNANDFET